MSDLILDNRIRLCYCILNNIKISNYEWICGRGVKGPRCPAAVKGTKARTATVMIIK